MTYSETRGMRSRIARFGAAIIGLSGILYSSPGFTQTKAIIRPYEYDENIKNYSTEWRPIEDPGGADIYRDQTVMVGTILSSIPDATFMHFLRQDNAGTILDNVRYEFNPDHEVRAIDVVGIDHDLFAIVGFERKDPANTTDDCIRVITVDETGALQKQGRIASTDNLWPNLYATHSIWHDGYLYICGYVVANTGLTNRYPAHLPISSVGFANYRRAFVIKYDINSMSVQNAKYYGYTYTGAGATPSNINYDYDMALRMKATSRGDIYVTGSANSAAWDPTALGGFGNYEAVSATLSMLIDPGNLNYISGEPFNPLYNTGANGTRMEYGVDMIELGDYFYVLSNTFSDHGTIANGFDFEPENMCISAIDTTGVPYAPAPTANSDKRINITDNADYWWGLQMLPSKNNDIMVAGLQADDPMGCTASGGAPTPSWDNFNPFLLDCSVTYSSSTGLTLTYDFWSVHLSQAGTGRQVNANSYYQLGGGISHWAWQPTFAARPPFGYDPDDEIVLSAPREEVSGTYLNLKYIRADEDGEGKNNNNPDCPDNVFSCEPNSQQAYDLYALSTTPYGPFQQQLDTGNLAIQDEYETVTTRNVTMYELGCAESAGIPKYGVTGVENIITSDKGIGIYPNPATGTITVALSTENNKTARVELINIYGQHIKTLYSGRADELRGGKTLILPDVANGLYMMKIYIDDELAAHEKLEIRQ